MVAARARFQAAADPEALVPEGAYCYSRTALPPGTGDTPPRPGTRPCPFWARNPAKGHQQDGYCALMGSGDWEEDGLSLLWDQVKECGVNLGTDPS